MSNYPHFTFEQLADAAEGRAAITNDARSHLTDCKDCRTEYSRLENIVSLMRSDELVDAPVSVLQRAVQLFQPQRANSPSLFKRVMAVLQFDSATMEPAFGVRATGGLVRQMLFNAGPYDVDIRLQPSEKGWQVAGQVLGAGQSGSVTLQAIDQRIVAQTELNDLLEFSLAPIAAGQYEFVLHVEQTEVVIPAFILPIN